MLREYQTTGISSIAAAFSSGKRAPILVSPTGSGKTVIASEIIRRSVAKGKTSMFIAHREELIANASHKIAEQGIRHNLICAPDMQRRIVSDQFMALGRSFVSTQPEPVSVAMIRTLFSRVGRGENYSPDLILIDECHLSISPTYKKVIAALPSARLIGLTATPQRLSGEGMGEVYDDIVVLVEPDALEAMGFLVPIKAYGSPITPDTSQIKTSMGDFNSSEISSLMDTSEISGDAVKNYRLHADGKRAIVFTTSITHAHHVAENFRAAGFRAVAVDGDSDKGLRASAVKQIESGEIDVLVNCGLYIEGLDCPSIECVIDLAPTQSVTRFMQKIGRGLRPSERTGKTNAIILDHAGNFMRHGHPYDSREWSLDGRKKKEKTDEVRLMTCEKCFAIYSPAPVCPVCGNEQAPKVRAEKTVADVDLVEIERAHLDIIRRTKRLEQGRAQTVDDLMNIPGMVRSRAHKIVQAREEKAALVEQAMFVARSRGGISLAEVRRMKPKQLKELIGL